MAEKIQLAGIPKNIPNEVIVPIPSNVPNIVKRIIYGKVQSALKRNTRVVYQDMSETKIALDLIMQMEKATSILLSRVSMNPDAVVPFVRRYFKTLEEMGSMTKTACEQAGIQYKEPRGLAVARKMNAGETKEEASGVSTEETAIESEETASKGKEKIAKVG